MLMITFNQKMAWIVFVQLYHKYFLHNVFFLKTDYSENWIHLNEYKQV